MVDTSSYFIKIFVFIKTSIYNVIYYILCYLQLDIKHYSCHESGCHSTTWTLAPHYSCTSLHLRLQLPSFTALPTPTHHTIALITQLSPITHLPWLSHHTCTSFTHISSTLPCTHCEVLFLPCRHFWALFPCWISCCQPGLFLAT